jgi:hypothetical protein
MALDILYLDDADPLALDDSGDLLEIESASVASTYSPNYVRWTDFREYRRGRYPGDFTARNSTTSIDVRVEGGPHELSHRNRLLLSGTGSRTVNSWNVVDLDPNRADQECCALVRCVGSSPVDRGVNILRAQSGVESFYRVKFSFSLQQVSIEKVTAGVVSTLGTPVTKAFKVGTFYVCTFRANGTTLSCKVWNLGDTEPIAWDIPSVTDSSFSDGFVGLQSTVVASSAEQWECWFFSVATNGESALTPSSALLSEPMGSWISEPDEEVEIAFRFEYYDPATNTVREEWYSTHGRSSTSYDDFPSSTAINPISSSSAQPYDLGSWTTQLQADAYLSGEGSVSPPTMIFPNLPSSPSSAGIFDTWLTKSFSNRPVERRVGRRWQVRPSPSSPNGILNPMRRFEIQASASMSKEGGLNPATNTITLSPLSILSQPVPVNKNIGIATQAQMLSNTGYLFIPSSTTYDKLSFKISARFSVPLTGVAGTGSGWVSRRITGGLYYQWSISIGYASHPTTPNKLSVMANASDNSTLFSYTYGIALNDGLVHSVVLAINSRDRWYLILDGNKVISGTGLTKDVKQATGSNVEVGLVMPNISVFDHRIEAFTDEDEATVKFSSRKDPDSLTYSMHRVDDNSGSTVTDYATLANHGTLQGILNTDFQWVPTYMGSAETAGTYMPMSGGVIFHAPTQPVDPVRNIFRHNDRAVTVGASVKIRSRGLVIAGGGVGYSEPVAGPGTVDFVGAIDEPVTFGLDPSPSTPENENIFVPKLVRDELTGRGALTSATIDQESFVGVRQLLPLKGGYYYTDPPSISTFLSDNLGSIGGMFGLDTSGRAYASIVLPPINPGPYGNIDNCLEFLGLPFRGVTINPHSSYSLKQSPIWSVVCWVKFHRRPVDPSTSSTFTYFPTGMTLVDHVDGATGYYLGVDGRDGGIVFGAPGVTGTVSGLHFLKRIYAFEPGKWYLVGGYQDTNTRMISVGMPGSGVILNTLSETTTGTLSASDNAPLRIGHGPRGSFYGSLQYVIGSSSGRETSPNQASVTTTPPTPLNATIVDRFFVDLRDNRIEESPVDRVYEQVQGRYGVNEGTRWAPRLTLDLTRSGRPTLTDIHTPIPAWRVDAEYKVNKSLVTGANVAGAVSSSDKLALQMSSLSSALVDNNIRSNFLNSQDRSVTTPLLSANDADYVSWLLRKRISNDRRLSDLGELSREIAKLSLTDEIVLVYSRFGLTGGFPCRVAMLVSFLGASGETAGAVSVWG